MTSDDKYETTQWEVSVMELQSEAGMRFKVTRRIPAMGISETKMFDSRAGAMKQLEEWLQ